MPRRKRSLDPEFGTLEIVWHRHLLQRRMMFVQIDGSRILTTECKCLASVPSINCPVDIHLIRALQILQKGESA